MKRSPLKISSFLFYGKGVICKANLPGCKVKWLPRRGHIYKAPAHNLPCNYNKTTIFLKKMAAKFKNGNYKHEIIVFFITVLTHLILETEKK